MLCLKEGQAIELSNNQTSGIFDILYIAIDPCNIFYGAQYTECASDE